MQQLSWYVHRFGAMSSRELAWRLRNAARDRVDYLRVMLNAIPRAHVIEREHSTLLATTSPRLCDVAVGEWITASPDEPEGRWRDRLIAQAELIVSHRLLLFGQERDLGARIDWNRDYERSITTPLGFAQSIDYRDLRRVGDAKLVWELNRHHHLVVLARAYRVTGDRRYATEAVSQLVSWLDQCPFGRGMNWRSPLELAVRLINWVWTIDLISDSGCLGSDASRRLLHALYLHVWEITRKFSRGSSANNHLIGEAAGTFVACCYFGELPRAAAWREASFNILSHEILEQTNADGGSREQAIGYQLFVFELLLIAGLVGRRFGHEFSGAFWNRLQRMLDFVTALGECGPLPLIGDADDGYVLDLGRSDSLQVWQCVGSVLFQRGDFKAAVGDAKEPARWLLGRGFRTQFERLATPIPTQATSRAFPETGYFLLQSQMKEPGGSISLLFDCGPLGFSTLAAHGHADALSFVLRAFGRDILVDPGTFDYFSYPEWRAYFRSTGAHNTVTIDHLDQSVQSGLFLWRRHARARCLTWLPHADGGVVEGEHDGYGRLADPVSHRRWIQLDASGGLIVVRDSLSLRAPHEIALSFHLAEDCEPVQRSEDVWDVHIENHVVTMSFDRRLRTHVHHGIEQSPRGWISRGYHRKTATSTITANMSAQESIVLECRIEVDNIGHKGSKL